jgi:two-component sensor histidine kinase
MVWSNSDILTETSVTETLQRSNVRLESLLHEANHRVANSLQLVSSLVHMHTSTVADPIARMALNDAQQRLQAIAQLHRALYAGDDIDTVAMEDYLAALVAKLGEIWSTPVAPRILNLSCEPIKIRSRQALSLGVIANELVSNACKYAYSPTDPGEIRISLAMEYQDRLLLCVEDDGSGLCDYPSSHGTGLGTRVLRTLVQSLNATLVYDSSHHGVRATLGVPL